MKTFIEKTAGRKSSTSPEKILLVGNPNAGKTTIFNLLTGENLRTGNYNGVTTFAARGTFFYEGKHYELTDLPGAYSLKTQRAEETVTAKVIASEKSFVLIVIEAENLLSSLPLTKEIISLGRPCAAVVTKYKDFTKRGGKLDVKKFSEYLGIPVISDVDKNAFKEFVRDCTKLQSKPEKSPVSHVNGVKNEITDFYKKPKIETFTRLDKVLTGNVTGIICALLVAAASMYLAFGNYSPGAVLGKSFTRIFSYFGQKTKLLLIKINAPEVLVNFITNGIFSGVSGVLGFIPQLAVLYLCSVIIEQSGYLARLSYLFDGLLKKFGLSGRAVFPFIVGFGCTAQAVLLSGSAESEREKRSLLFALGFVPCSARLPIISLLITAFFPEKSFFIIFSVYLAGIFFGLLISYAYSDEKLERNELFAFELPRLKMPGPKICIKQLNFLLKTFIIKAITVLSVVSAILWFLKSFGVNFEYLGEERISESLLAFLGGRTSFIFAPMGFKGWQMPVIAISGLIAKEGMLSAVFLVGGEEFLSSISPLAALSLIAFSSFYTPCVMSLSAVKERSNARFCAIYGAFTFVNGLAFGYFTYFATMVISKIGFLSTLVIPLSFAILSFSYAWLFKCVKRVKAKINRSSFVRGKINYKKNAEIHFACKRKARKTDMCAGCPVRCGYESVALERRQTKRQTPK